jgi:hypothetical protein
LESIKKARRYRLTFYKRRPNTFFPKFETGRKKALSIKCEEIMEFQKLSFNTKPIRFSDVAFIIIAASIFYGAVFISGMKYDVRKSYDIATLEH